MKESIMENIKKYDDRYYATKITMMNKLVKNSATTFEMIDIRFGADIPSNIFSKRSLDR